MIVTRFAPAPTGYLHLGHVLNAIYVWGMARARGGRVLLRIEDHDRQRSRAEFESAILEDLDWLGFQPDQPPVRQSERGAIYTSALDRLRAAGLVYACECSRADIAHAAARLRAASVAKGSASGGRLPAADPPALPAKATAGYDPAIEEEVRYPGTCANKGLAERPGLGLRVRLAPTAESFVDLRHGPQPQRPSEQCGDLLVKDRDGNWTYQFAATVDDDVQGVTLVIRGDDLLQSTGRQIQLARLLGRREPPEFFHHALVMKTSTQKLSKSDRDTGVRELRAAGWRAAAVIGHAAFLGGLTRESRPITAVEVSSMISR